MPVLSGASPDIEQIIRPETAQERHLLQLPEFRHGLCWGEPRFGHPEGKVVFHVREVLQNIDRIPDLDASSRQDLRLIALAHDTFKYAEDRSRPRNWHLHHGRIARRFMEAHTDNQVVLDIIELHDDAYYAWLAERYEWREDVQPRTLSSLMQSVAHCAQLYYLFFKCDTRTGDKTQAPLKWFELNAPHIQKVTLL